MALPFVALRSGASLSCMYGVILETECCDYSKFRISFNTFCFATRAPVSLQILGSVLGGCCVAQLADQVGKIALVEPAFTLVVCSNCVKPQKISNCF
jgi:hypothetical protein